MRHSSLVSIASFSVLCASTLLSCGDPGDAMRVRAQAIKSPDDFVTTWDTTLGTTIPQDEIKLEITGTYDVDWDNDGMFDDLNVTGPITHAYGTSGVYTVRVRSTGALRFEFTMNNNPEAAKLLSVDQWGTIPWTSMEGMFRRCENLTTFPASPDAPNMSQVTDMSRMLQNATVFNGEMGHWDVSQVTDMSEMFNNARAFNQPLNSWQTFSVTDMYLMFGNAVDFNQPLNLWNTSGVTTMRSMFSGAHAFDQDISGWDTSQVTTMRGMFAGAADFNKPLGIWDTSQVTDMSFMFNNATTFNQPLSTWDTSQVQNMEVMFSSARAFNQQISRWDTSQVTDMRQMFLRADDFNQPLGRWDTSQVAEMQQMFQFASSFDQELGGWDIEQVTNLTGMLDRSSLSKRSYDNTLIGWSTQGVQPMLTLGADMLDYCAGDSARTALINTHGWAFTGDSLLCSAVDSDGDGTVLAMDADDADPCVPAPVFRSCGMSDFDLDGVPLFAENGALTNPNQADTDGDGLCDGTIDVPGTCVIGEDAVSSQDTDGDMLIDARDPDDDGDGVNTIDEDGDGDGDPTNDIGTNGPKYLDPCDPNMNALTCPTGDTDGDGVDNQTERAMPVSDPLNACDPDPNNMACSDDSDLDGILNFDEIGLGTLPTNADTDGDGLCDGVVSVMGICTGGEDAEGGQNSDNDSLIDALDDDDDNDTKPTRDEDIDGDGDYVEHDTDGDTVSDWLDSDDNDGPLGDIDFDGITNGQEVMLGTLPNDADSDSDGVCDGTISLMAVCAAGEDAVGGKNTDGDMLIDALDLDDDDDGVNTIDEDDGDGDPTNDDVNMNNIPDYLDACEPDPMHPSCGLSDSDGDGVPANMDPAPLDPCIPSSNALACPTGDTDGDGITNGDELALGLDPDRADTDGDNICDGSITVTMGCTIAGPDPRNGEVCVMGRVCDIPTGNMCSFNDSCASTSCQNNLCTCMTDADCAMGKTCNMGFMPAQCTPIPMCGDGTIDANEQCDDSNQMNGDGCDEFCMNEATEDMGTPDMGTPDMGSMDMGSMDMGSMDDMGPDLGGMDMDIMDDMGSQGDMLDDLDMELQDMAVVPDMSRPDEDMGAPIQDMSSDDMPSPVSDMAQADEDMNAPTDDSNRPDVVSCATTSGLPPAAPAPWLLGALLGVVGLRRRRRARR